MVKVTSPVAHWQAQSLSLSRTRSLAHSLTQVTSPLLYRQAESLRSGSTCSQPTCKLCSTTRSSRGGRRPRWLRVLQAACAAAGVGFRLSGFGCRVYGRGVPLDSLTCCKLPALLRALAFRPSAPLVSVRSLFVPREHGGARLSG